MADAGTGVANNYAKDYVNSTPQFEWYYSVSLNKIRLFRTDTGGKMALGKFDIQTGGVKLGMALGFNHITAQQLRDLNLSSSVKTSVENSVHYRETTLTEYNDFTILNPTNSATYLEGDKRKDQYGHSVLSANCVNMFANDSVYLRIGNLPANAYETLYGGLTNVMAVIPMYSGSSSTENFYSPSNVISTNIGSSGVSELDIRLTDAFGDELDFNGVENEFMLMFEAFADGTRPDKPPEQGFAERNFVNQFHNIHRNVVATFVCVAEPIAQFFFRRLEVNQFQFYQSLFLAMATPSSMMYRSGGKPVAISSTRRIVRVTPEGGTSGYEPDVNPVIRLELSPSLGFLDTHQSYLSFRVKTKGATVNHTKECRLDENCMSWVRDFTIYSAARALCWKTCNTTTC